MIEIPTKKSDVGDQSDLNESDNNFFLSDISIEDLPEPVKDQKSEMSRSKSQEKPTSGFVISEDEPGRFRKNVFVLKLISFLLNDSLIRNR